MGELGREKKLSRGEEGGRDPRRGSTEACNWEIKGFFSVWMSPTASAESLAVGQKAPTLMSSSLAFATRCQANSKAHAPRSERPGSPLTVQGGVKIEFP